jgi:beta-lactamase class D
MIKPVRLVDSLSVMTMSKLTTGVLALWLVAVSSVTQAAPMCTLLADAATNRLVKRVGQHCDQRFTPASTFKIPLSLMGYDSGFLTDEHLPAIPYREGSPALDPSWKTTVDPTSWIKNSVVWYSQQITSWLGKERLQRYVTRFNYGNQDLSGNPGMNDGLTQAWLSSSLRISPLEQVTFLEKLLARQLPVSASFPMAGAYAARPGLGSRCTRTGLRTFPGRSAGSWAGLPRASAPSCSSTPSGTSRHSPRAPDCGRGRPSWSSCRDCWTHCRLQLTLCQRRRQPRSPEVAAAGRLLRGRCSRGAAQPRAGIEFASGVSET